MSSLLPFIVIGIATGAVYGLAGTGLVLTYKTSGIFNFAYGSIAAISVFVFYWLHDEHGMAWPLAAVLCVLVLAPIEGLLLELLARALEPVGAMLKVVATVGLLLIVLGAGTLWYGNNTSSFPAFLPTSTVRMLGVNVQWQQIIVVIVAVVASGILFWFFRFVRMGVAMRGVVDNPDLVSMTGESPARVRRWAWIIGTVFAAMAGLLLAPSLPLDALIITMLVVQAFGAAAIGYFSSLPLTFIGGLVVGVAAAVATKYTASVTWLSGLAEGLPFILLFIVLVVTPRARLVERRVTRALQVHRPWYAPTRVRLATGLVLTVVLLFLPKLVGFNLSVWSEALVFVIVFLSLGLLVRTSGQLSLCHLAFAAVGAAAFGHFTDDWHIPWLLAILLAGLIAVPVGALIAIPAIRLSGVFLALATLGFGVLLEQMIYTTNLMFGPTSSGIPAPRPDVSLWGWHLSTDTGFYYVLLLFAGATVAVVMAIQRGRLGRLLGGLADSPMALETHGATTNVVRILLFCISAAIASVAGALLATVFHYGVGSNYASFESLTLVALVIISIGGDPWYAVIAAVGFAVVPGYLTVSNISTYLEILFGVFATMYAMNGGKVPEVPARVRAVLDRIGGRAPAAAPPAALALAAAGAGAPDVVTAAAGGPLDNGRAGAGGTVTPRAAADGRSDLARRDAGEPAPPPAGRSGLEVRQLAVHFGGVRAVQDVSLQAPTGRITGLVGPNGAGKTTTFNACSGLVRPTSGRIVLHGTDVTRLGPAGRARRGLGRTFQRAELFNSLSVRENVELGREASLAGGSPVAQLMARRGEKALVRRAVDDAIELTGIGPLAELQAGLLTTGQRRMVELARVLAGPFDLLLLDEPSAGLDGTETHRFGEILGEVVAERGVGILLVEHDMELVRQVCEVIYVLDFGRLIFEGGPDEMLASEVVRAAYLGTGRVGEAGGEETMAAGAVAEELTS
ncbi:MAG: ABC transporter permease subunit [Acidimicrobiales bacterium]